MTREGKLTTDAELIAELRVAFARLEQLTRYGEDSIRRPAEYARSIISAAVYRLEALSGEGEPVAGEEFLEFKEALSDLRSLRHEYKDLNGGGPGWSQRNRAAWAKVDELFANEDEAAYDRQQESFYG